MQNNTIEPLAWDSQFFGYPVARIALDQNGGKELAQLFERLLDEKFRLTYLFVPLSEKEANESIIQKGAILVDQKTVFLKPTEKHSGYSNHISELQGVEITEKLIELTLQAGLFSRFHLDKNFVKQEYERLYIEWITRSVKKELSFKTLLALRDSDIIGITTMDDEKDHVHIGLVAVDDKYRGQGVGYDLIRTADSIAFAMGFKEIKVVTQLHNKGACRLYEKCGFHMASTTNVYHFWQ